MIKAVIFDLDNTLVDFMKMKESGINAAVNAMIETGLDIPPNLAKNKIFKIYENKGWEYQAVFDELLNDELGFINYKILASAIVEYRKAKEVSLALYPNVYSTLIKLSKLGLKIGVVTDAPSREAWTRLYSVNLHHIFDAVVTFEDTLEKKPSPKPFKLMSKLLNISFKNMIMVGDWPERDIEGASKIGMKTAFAKYGSIFETKKSYANYDINDISEILNIIKKCNL